MRHPISRPRRILLTTQMVITGALGLLGPIYAIYVERIGGDILAASSSAAIFSLVYGSLVMALGRLEDKVKESEYFIVGGFYLSALGFFGYLFVADTYQLFLVQIILGVALAIMTPAHDALYTKHLEKGKEASERGLWEGLYYITEGVTAFIGGVIVAYFGFSAIFIIMTSAAAVTGTYILLLPRRVL